VVESAFVAAIIVTALVTNVAGIGSDLAAVLALRALPAGTLLYYGEKAQLAYEPAKPVASAVFS
jgi:O6-methylguanine-DNA--protein-cysteine methyltransferase